MALFRIITISYILCFFLSVDLGAQNISVKDFNSIPDDLTARISAPKVDQNGDKCAIIKMVTSQKGFVFEGDMNGIVNTEFKIGEYWIYVPYGSKKITIKHSKLGIIRNYQYPMPIKEAAVYEMILITGVITTKVKPLKISMQWLTISSKPQGVDIYIEDQYVGVTPYQKKMKVGEYDFRLSKFLHHSMTGKIKLTEFKKENLNLELKPNYGSLKLSAKPENGASIEIDGIPYQKKTPTIIGALKSGQHIVKLKKEMYAPIQVDFNIYDGETTELLIDLTPNFSEIRITTNPQSSIWIDGEYVGSDSIVSRLTPGLHVFEAQKESYETDRVQKKLIKGEISTIDLRPVPIVGSLDISTFPLEVRVYENEEYLGTTPMTINNLLIGEHEFILRKDKYGERHKMVNIIANAIKNLTVDLSLGKEISIKSHPVTAKVFIDNRFVGFTPIKQSLSFGMHDITFEYQNVRELQNIMVSDSSRSIYYLNTEIFKNYTQEIGNEEMNFIAVKGGLFNMGNNGKKPDEEPVHEVNLDDFYIGKYEVTQEQWMAIMGTNPSKVKGDKLPVYSVSWNMIQVYVKKLNSVTRMNYRLPTEAEWEYASKGGSNSQGYIYSGSMDLDKIAVYSENSSKAIHEVGMKHPNELGLHDMTGNVWEWCNDIYGEHYYSNREIENPKGSSHGIYKVCRGGDYLLGPFFQRICNRGYGIPNYNYNTNGFRLVRSVSN
ncbi:MAG: SUMF1/EgtB/PvdO family nonheme iron enzyme [Labilibaculum sp.]|nr:SUMF1/EgtB/PvdO family nonheme iron enzyme [Labilibaculum sp.]